MKKLLEAEKVRGIAVVYEDGHMQFANIKEFPRIDKIGDTYIITDPSLIDIPKVKIIGLKNTWEVVS